MRIAMLGPLEVWDGRDRAVTLGGGRLRALLALLALSAGRPVGTERLIDGLWGTEPPSGAGNALQSLVSRLRRSIGDGAAADPLRSTPAGYLLDLPPDAVDAHRFGRLAATGREALDAGDADRAAEALGAALELWRGPALADVTAPFAATEVAGLTDTRLAVVADLAAARLAQGRPADAVAVVAGPAAEHPLRERLCALAVRALCAAGRQAEALARFEATRQALSDELGVDPSAELSAVHVAALRGELSGPAVPVAVPVAAPVSPAPGEPEPPRRTNLRTPVSSFIGRDTDVREVRKMLADGRLVTLVGPGGTGKTRLATEASAGLLDDVPDGVWLAELAPVSDPADVPHAVLSALGGVEPRIMLNTGQPAAPTAGPDPTGRLLSALAGRQLVLVLDNCEHVVDAAARLTDTVLAHCPGVRVLATSRSALGITGESLYPVPPLALPDDGASAAVAGGVASVRLLADRAAAVRPGFSVTDGNVRAVAQICRTLDGAPLALELAAARLRSLDPGQLVTRLDDRFRLLTGGSRTALPRHQTLRAVVEWSWELLDEPGRALCRRLSAFAGGATLDALEAVCADPPGTGAPVLPADAVLDVLAGLVDQSLVEPTGAGTDGPVRYRMLETIRAYAADRLAEAGEAARVRTVHVEHYLAVAERTEPVLRTAGQMDALHLFGSEHDNLQVALRTCVDTGSVALLLRLIAALTWYWFLLGYHREAWLWAGEALRLAPEPPPGLAGPHLMCEALVMMSRMFEARRDGAETAGPDSWAALCEGFQRRYPRVEAEGTPHPLLAAGNAVTLMFGGETERARAIVEEACRAGDEWVRAGGHLFRAQLNEHMGDVRSVRADLTEAVACYRRTGERWGLSTALMSLAERLVTAGEYDEAMASVNEAWTIARQFMTVREQPGFLAQLASLRARAGDLDAAEADLATVRAILGDRLDGPSAPAPPARPAVPADLPAGTETGQLWDQPSTEMGEIRYFIGITEAEVARRRGDPATARAVLTDLLEHYDRSVGRRPPQLMAGLMAALARLDLETGDPDGADTWLRKGMVVLAPTRDQPLLAVLLDGLTVVADRRGERERAVLLAAAADATRGGPCGEADVRAAVAAARAALPPDVAERAAGRGAELDYDAVYEMFGIPIPDGGFSWPVVAPKKDEPSRRSGDRRDG